MFEDVPMEDLRLHCIVSRIGSGFRGCLIIPILVVQKFQYFFKLLKLMQNDIVMLNKNNCTRTIIRQAVDSLSL